MGKISPAMVVPLHLAIVKIRAPETLTDEVLNGVGRTLSQLAKLGLTSTVVVECGDSTQSVQASTSAAWKDRIFEQVDRVVSAIQENGQPGARRMDSIFEVQDSTTSGVDEPVRSHKRLIVTNRKLLMTPLRRGVIPVLPAIGYTRTSVQAVPVRADDAILALTREFAGFQAPHLPDEDPALVREVLQALRSEVSVDRLIVVDPLGGTPSSDRPNGTHVFLNIEQEFEGIKEELTTAPIKQHVTQPSSVTDIASGNPISKFLETELGTTPRPSVEAKAPEGAQIVQNASQIHLENLELVREFLSLLPSSSSAILTSPQEAAHSNRPQEVPFKADQVGTRRTKNPLIHNLLTDKPIVSSSLPLGRIQSPPQAGYAQTSSQPPANSTTFAKRGMPISIYPDPKIAPWQPPRPGQPSISLTDPQIDLARLVHLIDDSFNRKLDTEAYLRRINGRIAGVIIAGEYEGGALLTWELPPGVPDDGSEESRAQMVPYLDKFAVLKRSQGVGGVADIVFKAMVRDCFPDGVCWRSRKNNPVNRWYFERSRGTWKMPGTNWTMFWTTQGLELEENVNIFNRYEAVCRNIQPTWADDKKVVD